MANAHRPAAAIPTLIVATLLMAACRSDAPALQNDGSRVGQAGAPALPATCPQGRGPAMAALSAPDGSRYCIDTTEVTQAQYALFLETAPSDPAAQTREMCRTANPSFVPKPASDTSRGCPAGLYDPKTRPDSPMPCADFCDAVAFCEWAGKQLCGSVTGGPLGLEDPKSKDAWYLACSQGGRTRFSVGDDVSRSQCNFGHVQLELSTSATATCRGESAPWSEVLDLSGSVDEWQDACDDRGMCRIRGGSAASLDATYLECGGEALAPPGHFSGVSTTTGIRCCAPLAAGPLVSVVR